MEKHKHGGDIYSRKYKIDFSANINPLGPPESVIRAVQEAGEQIQNYPDVEQRRLKKALAEKEQVPKEWLIFGNGAAELIFALCLGLRPKRALLAAPGFAEYGQALEACGCEIRWYKLKREMGFQIQEDFCTLLGRDTDIVFLCNPNNPTGVLIPQKILKKTAGICRANGTLLVVDECFNDFVEEPDQHSVKSLVAENDFLFILKAFTKIYAMPGLRLGYGICRNAKVLDHMRRVIQPWSVSVPAQEAGEAALGETAYVQRAQMLVRQEWRILTEGLREMGLTVWEGAANYLFFYGPVGLAGLCEKEGYLIRDCSNYRGLSEGYYRIAVRTHAENEEFLTALAHIMKNF